MDATPAPERATSAPERPHPALERAFAALDRSGLRWLVLRGDLTLGRPDGDVDLLVDPGTARRAVRALRPAGLVEVPGRGYGTHRFVLGRDAGTGAWVRVDVFDQLSFGSVRLSDQMVAGCLGRRRSEGGAARPDPADQFWLVLLHALLERRAVPPAQEEQLRRLAAHHPESSPLAGLVGEACPGSGQRLSATVRRAADRARRAGLARTEGARRFAAYRASRPSIPLP